MTPEQHAEWVAKLLAIRERYIVEGGNLLSWDEIDAEMAELRGKQSKPEVKS